MKRITGWAIAILSVALFVSAKALAGVPVITSPGSMTAYLFDPFSYQITAANSPTSFNAVGLPKFACPANICPPVNTNTGLITGDRLVDSGQYTVMLSATNGEGTATMPLSLHVFLPKPVITSPTSATGFVGTPFAYAVTATDQLKSPPFGFKITGGDLSCDVIPLFGCNGMTFNPSNGVLSGTPVKAGVFRVIISVTIGPGSPDSTTTNMTLTLTINPASTLPVITSAASVSGTVGAPLSYAITATNSPTRYSAWSLPPGLTVNTQTGVISGTPTTAGSYTATVNAFNASGTGTKPVAFTIIPLPPVITSAGSAAGRVGISLYYGITATNSPTSFSATGLPSGLSLNAQTGAISGAPTAGGVFNVTLGAANAGGTGSKTLVFTVMAPPVITSAAGASGTVGSPLNYAITATNSPTSYSAWSLPPGLSVSSQTGTISGTPTTVGSYNATVNAINAAGTGTKQVVFTITPLKPVITSAASATGRVGVSLYYGITATNSPTSFSATGLPAGLSLNAQTGAISGAPTAGGIFNVTLGATNAGGTGNKTLAFTVIAPPVNTSRDGPLNGIVGQQEFYDITATNSPTSYSAWGLPPGLSVNAQTGAIRGTCNTVGTFTMTVNATNAAGTGSKQVVWTMLPYPAPVITSAATATGRVGVSLYYGITATNSPSSFSATGLPSGLSLNAQTGAISGAPTAGGVFNVTLGAANVMGTGHKTLVFTVIAPPVVTSAASASGTQGSALSYSITATNSPTGYSAWSMPPGLSVNAATGLISGTPTSAGSYTATVNAINTAGTGTKQVVFTIIPLKPVITYSAIPAWRVGINNYFGFTAANNPTSYNATGLPLGLSLTGTGTWGGGISGTPTKKGTYSVTITGTNAGGSGSTTVVFTVN